MKHEMKTFRVVSNEKASASARVITLDGTVDAAPGQFAMVWLPGKGQKPFSFAGADPVEFVVEAVGAFSESLCALDKGDRLSLVGPLGRGFSTEGVKRAALVGGGCGAAPLRHLSRCLAKEGTEHVTFLGAATSDRLVCATSWPGPVDVATDDGTTGFHGNCVDNLARAMDEKPFDRIYGCGPEKMLQALVWKARPWEVSLEVSLERYMKCGVGMCGHCAMDYSGWLVCTEGPVIGGKALEGLEEFDHYRRDPCGGRCPVA